jgi:hypothetical protein
MTKKDREEFQAYLQACTDRQVYGVLEKEQKAGRRAYANLAREELARRNLLGGI